MTAPIFQPTQAQIEAAAYAICATGHAPTDFCNAYPGQIGTISRRPPCERSMRAAKSALKTLRVAQ